MGGLAQAAMFGSLSEDGDSRGNDFFRFEHTGGQLVFEICIDGTPPGCTGGGSYSVTVAGAARSWRASEWVHLRTDWDAGTGMRVWSTGPRSAPESSRPRWA
jgi:hypothetical protein